MLSLTSSAFPLHAAQHIWLLRCGHYLTKLGCYALQVSEVRNCLDTGTPFRSDIQSHSIAEALVQFLRALPEAVIPRKYFHEVKKKETCISICTTSSSEIGCCSFAPLLNLWEIIFDHASHVPRDIIGRASTLIARRKSAGQPWSPCPLSNLDCSSISSASCESCLPIRQKTSEHAHLT